jgi:hypothetical protein
MPKLPKLTILLPTVLVAWLVGCVAVHGPAIFAYLAMHVVTTGVFATFVLRAERRAQNSSTSASASKVAGPQTSAKTDRTPAQVEKQAAVA